jgi:hypothetical protein
VNDARLGSPRDTTEKGTIQTNSVACRGTTIEIARMKRTPSWFCQRSASLVEELGLCVCVCVGGGGTDGLTLQILAMASAGKRSNPPLNKIRNQPII